MEYLQDKVIQVVLVIGQNLANHILLLSILCLLMNVKVPLKRKITCATVISIFYLLPIYFADFLFYYPQFRFPSWLYCLMIFINPVTGLMYYFVVKKLLQFPPTRAVIVTHMQLLMHYIIVLFYLSANNIYAWIWGSHEIMKDFYAADLVSILLVLLLLICIYFWLAHRLKKSSRYMIIPPQYTEKNIAKNILVLMLSILIIYVSAEFYLVFLVPSIHMPINLMSGCLYLLMLVTVLLYLLHTMSLFRTRLLDWQMQATGTYISSLLHANQEFRSVKHDFYNVLQAYGGYLSIKDYKGLEQYHKKLFATTTDAGSFLSLIEVLRSRIVVYSLLREKSEKAKTAGVTFSINAVCEVNHVVLSDFDLCRILGIVIDNAIEEAEKSLEKQVNISFERKGENTVIFVISNTTKNDVETHHIFEEGYTTKPGHMGIGLTQVLKTLTQYEHCYLRVNYHDNQFSLFLMLDARKTEKK